ncbi:hypothetical protein F5Y19DRAFT_411398 [Xylariaceae sp. FL1651]|nr:hypothetical protein F5Y19DRAFT_411398 [Xylariaceae sp. FL1651]
MAASSATISPATYDLIQGWAVQQRQTPAPLTEKLRDAVINLELALMTELAPRPEPEIGDSNWVGLLLEYRAAHPQTPNGIRGVTFTEGSEDPTGRGPLRWLCHVTIDEHPEGPFPGAAGGQHDDGSQPKFMRKKDAKQYAAKCAVEWLRATGRMPQEGGVKFPKAATTVPQQQQKQQQSRQSVKSPSPFIKQETPSPPPHAIVIPSSPFDETQPSAIHEVDQLCKALFLPSPSYKIEPAGGAGGEFWNGRAEFGTDRELLPFSVEDLVRVENVLGKKAAKEMVAEDLRKHLRAEKARRAEADRIFLARGLFGAGGGRGDGGVRVE